MWEQCTQLALRAVSFAQEEAANRGENYVGTEHLLLGLLREPDNVFVRVLTLLRVSPSDLRSDVVRQIGNHYRERHHPEQPMQLSIRAYQAIVRAQEETQKLGHTLTGTGHLLLGLIQVSEGLASHVMIKRGLELEPLRREVAALQDEEDQRSASEL
jgi:ATP-dependent Clp protease ATP-binding subunit ClpC